MFCMFVNSIGLVTFLDLAILMFRVLLTSALTFMLTCFVTIRSYGLSIFLLRILLRVNVLLFELRVFTPDDTRSKDRLTPPWRLCQPRRRKGVCVSNHRSNTYIDPSL